MDITGAIAIISVFGFVPVIVYLVHRHKERKLLIEKGMDASILETTKKDYSMQSLKWGILLIGVAIGILVGNLLEAYTKMYEEVAYFSMIFLFGGIALVVYYILAKRHEMPK